MMLLPHTVTVAVASTVTDAYGATRLTYSGTPSTVRAFVQPAGQTEDSDGRVVTDLRMFTEVPVAVTSRVTYAGAVYEVVGVDAWSGPIPHHESRLRKVDG